MTGTPIRRAVRSPWRKWFPLALAVALLALAPALAHAQEADSVVVRWTAPGDDGNVGTATAYDLRVSDSPITAGNFAAATAVSGVPVPRTSGTAQRVAVYGLARGTTYYFAIRSVDDQGNWSGVSNVARWDWTLDTSPPAAPLDPQVERTADGVRVTWEANAEADLAGYHVYRRLAGGTAVKLTAQPVVGTEYLDTTAPPDAALAYEVTAVDASGNESAHSDGAVITVVTANAWRLETGYPNPSRIGQAVRFPVIVPATVAGDVGVDILDAGGRRVRHLVLSSSQPGLQEVVWDGRNDAGRESAPGVYRGWLIAGEARASVRVLRVP